MVVDDHGLEVLKKSGEEVTPGNKSDYYLKTKDVESSLKKTIRIDKVSTTLTYIGYALIGTSNSSPGWRVLSLATSGTVISLKWADGDENYDNIWDNRASLAYS